MEATVIKNPFRQGQRVRIKKGCKFYFTTHPQKKKNPIAGRDYEVVLDRVYDGRKNGTPAYPGQEEAHYLDVLPEVVWAGAGGYWFHSRDFKNIEAIDP